MIVCCQFYFWHLFHGREKYKRTYEESTRSRMHLRWRVSRPLYCHHLKSQIFYFHFLFLYPLLIPITLRWPHQHPGIDFSRLDGSPSDTRGPSPCYGLAIFSDATKIPWGACNLAYTERYLLISIFKSLIILVIHKIQVI